METLRLKTAGPRVALVLLLASAVTFAQDEPADAAALEPAVDTSADLEPAVDTSAAAEAAPAKSERPTAPSAPAPAVAQRGSDGKVMDRMELGRTEITGNQELPKVLYIVPWHKADPGNLIGRPVNTLLDEVLAPLDRDEFIRQVDYYDDLYGDKQE